MIIRLKKIGSDWGLVIPSRVLKKLSWDEKTSIQLEVSSGAIHLSKRRLSLKELCATVPNALRDDELTWGSSVVGEDD